MPLFDPNQTRRQPLKEVQYVAPLELPTEGHIALRMKMPNAIGEVPTSIVATTVLVAVAMTDTAWSNWFAT